MMEAYQSGDPYLAFGKQAGQIPPNGTKRTHGAERERFKACVLGVQYGMGPEALARRIGLPPAYGRELLQLHHETYPAFWRWSDGVQDHAMAKNFLYTTFGWTVRVGPDANPRSFRNFPCQANGAEMLRLACSLASERGANIVAPVHDAFMAEGPADAIDEVVTRTQEAMAEASEIVLAGFRLRSDAKIVRWPDRYMDARGREFWGRVMALLPTKAELDSRPLPIPVTFDEETGQVRGHVDWANAF
jgi:DNA polymerase family A